MSNTESPGRPLLRRLDRSSLRTGTFSFHYHGVILAQPSATTTTVTITATDATDMVVVGDAAVAVCLRCPPLIAIAVRCCSMSVSEIDDPYATSQTGHGRKPRTKKVSQIQQ